MKMDDHNDNWAKAENTDVEQAKDAFADAQTAETLRAQLTTHAAGAVKYGVDRDWVNSQLLHLGASQITGKSEYRMNIPVTGVYGWRTKATSRPEALAKFLEQVARVSDAGKITADGSYDNVYELKIVGDPIFYSGPEDPSTGDTVPLELDELKAGIRAMVKQGVSRYGWNLGYANRALSSMGLDTLPNASHRTVQVPVTGTTEMSVLVFEGDDDSEVQESTAKLLSRAGSVYIKPTEIGTVLIDARPDDEDEDVAF